MTSHPIAVAYVTSSPFKIEENIIFSAHCKLSDGRAVQDVFKFNIRHVEIKETLEVDLEAMVKAEAISAYQKIKIPCITEHAGIIFEDYLSEYYPGGLTKPMWNALGDRFVKETGSANRRAVARAVVAFCDGMNVYSFIGDTQGQIAPAPRGSIGFYWDTIFVPDEAPGVPGTKTYAEIVDDPALGRKFKVVNYSQSTRAMLKFLDHYKSGPPRELWGF